MIKAENRIRFCLACFISFLIVIQGVLLVCSEDIFAKAGADYWSWTELSPEVYKSDEVSGMAPGLCPKYYQTKEVDGYSDLKKICMTVGESVKFGTFYSDYAYRAAIGFRFDTKMYAVNGICNQHDNCLYLPGKDTLVTKQYIVNGIVRSLVIYKNFLSRLTPVKNLGVISTLEYNFDASNPDYIFESNSDIPYAWPIGGLGASKNGRWLAVEIRQRGVGMLDIDNLEMKRISTQKFSYGSGRNATTEFAVSDDGRHIVIAGTNSGFTIYDIDNVCGDEPTDDRLTYTIPVKNPCSKADIDTESFIHRLSHVLQPSINEGGSEIRFYAVPYVGNARQVTLRASGYSPKKLEYLALGDSFTSGEGELNEGYYLNGTNDEYEKCHVSERSYPFLLAQKLGIEDGLARNVACSGATTKDVVGDRDAYKGQGNRLGIDGANLDSMSIQLAQRLAIDNYIPGRVYQESFVINYQPSILTVGIGGNDISLMDKLNMCVLPLPTACETASDEKQRGQVATEIKNLFYKLVDVYKKLNESSQDSKIFAVGYPKIIDQTNVCYGWSGQPNGLLLNETERIFMNRGVEYLNDVIRAASKAAGVGFIDIENSFGNQVICGLEKPSAVNAISFGDDFNPFTNNRHFFVLGNEGFHPNNVGHSLIAGHITDSYDKLFDIEYCQNGQVFCPDDNIVPPDPSQDSISYWFGDDRNAYAIVQKSNFIKNRNIGENTNEKTIKLEPMSLMPGSALRFEVHSETIAVVEYIVSNDGSVNEDITIPDLEDGYHEYHLYGTSYTGQEIDLYQPFMYFDVKEIAEEPSIGIVDSEDEIIISNPNSDLNTENLLIKKITSDTNDSCDGCLGYDLTGNSVLGVDFHYSERKIEEDQSLHKNDVSSESVLGVYMDENKIADGVDGMYIMLAGFMILMTIIFIGWRFNKYSQQQSR